MSSRPTDLAAATLAAALGLVTIDTPLLAQTPRPAVAVRQHPSMLHSVWPADFNRDGHIDFVAGEPRPDPYTPGRVVVRPGNGGGGVGQPLATGVTGRPATIGDFNGDRLIDLVAVEDGGAMWILAGLGNGRFQAPRAVATVTFLRFALAADMNGDGRLDLVVGDENTVNVYPGNGNLTFGAAVTLPRGDEEHVTAGVAADLNRDGRRDLVVAQRRRSIIVYLNGGGLIFAPTEIVIEDFEDPDEIHGLTAADLNRDGRQDLIVPHAQGIFDYGPGGVDVLMGEGDGTFRRAVRYATGVNGPRTATTGDFNRDGVLDVAVGGRSWAWDDISDIKSHWDSVAIFPGRGNGELLPAAAFRLDTRTPPGPINTPWVNMHGALRTADVDGDGHDDLVASPLAILLNRPAAANRPPAIDAGPDLVDPSAASTIVAVRITEPDWDWLNVVWRDQFGRVISRATSFEYNIMEDITLTVTVTDVRGASATDTVTVRRDPANPVFVTVLAPAGGEFLRAGDPIRIRWDAYADPPVDHFQIDVSRDAFRTWFTLSEDIPGTAREFTWVNPGPPAVWHVRVYARASDRNAVAVDTSGAFTIETGAGTWPWEANGDIGAVGAPGTVAHADGVFHIRGAGAGVGGTADEFHALRTLNFTTTWFADRRFSITARVSSIEHVSDLTRAGLMLRDGLGPSDRHVSIFTTPTATNGVTFERRSTVGGSNVRTRRTSISGPAWLKLVRHDDIVRAFARQTRTSAWTLVGEQSVAGWSRLQIMLAVTSSVDAQRALARFDNVEIDELESYISVDITTAVPGTATTDGVTTRIEGDGNNIWGRADSFRFHTTVADLSRGGSITARVRSLENTSPLAKAGIMIRSDWDPGSPHVSLFVSPGGIKLQYRKTLHAESGQFATLAGTAPEWLRLTRNGNVFTATASNDGVTWTRVGAITLPMGELTFLGLAVTSSNPGTLATAVFDDVRIWP